MKYSFRWARAHATTISIERASKRTGQQWQWTKLFVCVCAFDVIWRCRSTKAHYTVAWNVTKTIKITASLSLFTSVRESQLHFMQSWMQLHNWSAYKYRIHLLLISVCLPVCVCVPCHAFSFSHFSFDVVAVVVFTVVVPLCVSHFHCNLLTMNPFTRIVYAIFIVIFNFVGQTHASQFRFVFIFVILYFSWPLFAYRDVEL